MTKIEALEKTIYNLENNVYEYNWGGYDSCNCGILARTVLGGKTAKESGLYDANTDGGLGMSGALQSGYEHCEVTGIKLPKVYQALKDAGFRKDEFTHIELLSRPDIFKRSGIPVLSYAQKSCVIAYFKAWVEILKEERVPKEKTIEPKPVKVIHHYVSVPESITEQTKELILS